MTDLKNFNVGDVLRMGEYRKASGHFTPDFVCISREGNILKFLLTPNNIKERVITPVDYFLRQREKRNKVPYTTTLSNAMMTKLDLSEQEFMVKYALPRGPKNPFGVLTSKELHNLSMKGASLVYDAYPDSHITPLMFEDDDAEDSIRMLGGVVNKEELIANASNILVLPVVFTATLPD